jgi:hypothetical protein
MKGNIRKRNAKNVHFRSEGDSYLLSDLNEQYWQWWERHLAFKKLEPAYHLSDLQVSYSTQFLITTKSTVKRCS